MIDRTYDDKSKCDNIYNVQDTLQFASLSKEGETNEISEYLLAIFGSTNMFNDKKYFQEFTFNDPTIENTYVKLIKGKRRMESEFFRIPAKIQKKPNLNENFKELILLYFHQAIVGEAIQRLNSEERINIVDVKILSRKSNSNQPSRYFVLALSNGNGNNKITKICDKLKEKEKCLGFQFPITGNEDFIEK